MQLGEVLILCEISHKILSMRGVISAIDAAVKWNIKNRRVALLCKEGRIPGAYKIGSSWAIPANAEKPADARIRSGKYIKKGKKTYGGKTG